MSHILIFDALLERASSDRMLRLIEQDAEATLALQSFAHAALLNEITAKMLTPRFMSSPDQRAWFLVTAARIHSFLDRGVPICDSQNPLHDPLVPASFTAFQEEKLSELVRLAWHDDVIPFLENLLAAYFRKGQLDLTSRTVPNPSGLNPASYLEVALMSSNPGCVRKLLEMGADEDLVPVKRFGNARDIDALLTAMFGPGPTPMRDAIAEGRRARLTFSMKTVIASQGPAAPHEITRAGRRRAHL